MEVRNETVKRCWDHRFDVEEPAAQVQEVEIDVYSSAQQFASHNRIDTFSLLNHDDEDNFSEEVDPSTFA